MKKRGLDLSLLDNVVDTLRQGKQLEAKYRDHELSGKFKGFRECHNKPDWLLIYLIEHDILTLTLVDTGTHADFFSFSSEAEYSMMDVRLICMLFIPALFLLIRWFAPLCGPGYNSP